MHKKNLLNLRNEVIELRKKIKTLEKEESELLAKLRKNCHHETIYETEYIPKTLVWRAQPPRRICIICGESEEGWDCGYEKLTKEPTKNVTSKVFNELRELKPLIPRMVVGG